MTVTLDAARAGDEVAFRELAAPHLHELHVHCYRMLGSVDDADDLLQETLIAAWQGLARFEGRSSLRTWLYRIATNRCLNSIRNGKRRPPPEPIPPFDPPPPDRTFDVPWLQPYPDGRLALDTDPTAPYQARETIELAFVAALQLLPPRQTAALLLCDVIGFPLAEVAAMLHDSPTAIKGVLQRARAAMGQSQPALASADASASTSAAVTESEARLAQRFAEAFADDDVDGVVALLTDDAWLAMPPAPHEYHGPAAIAAFLRASISWRPGQNPRLVPTSANRQPAFACYLPNGDGGTTFPAGIIVLTTSPDGISGITRFLDHHVHRHFNL